MRPTVISVAGKLRVSQGELADLPRIAILVQLLIVDVRVAVGLVHAAVGDHTCVTDNPRFGGGTRTLEAHGVDGGLKELSLDCRIYNAILNSFLQKV